MNFTINSKREGKILIATVVGRLDLQAYLSMRKTVRDSLEKTESQDILLDLQRAIVQVSFMEVFNAASTNVELFTYPKKYAIVYSAETIQEENAKFGETVAQNRGSNFRVFKDIDLAKEWLHQSE
jgi:hypothetical protein